jgi:hypothetical protein
MKANELMIGDWVNITEPDKYAGAKCIIMSLQEHKEEDNAYFEVFIRDKIGILRKDVCNADLIPIPLTPNIIKKNGWIPVDGVCASICRHNGYNLSILYLAKSGVNLTIDKGGYGPNLVCMPIEYVHQLQHALRLCGIEKEIEL